METDLPDANTFNNTAMAPLYKPPATDAPSSLPMTPINVVAAEGCYAKVFLWDTNTMVPLMEAVELR